MFNLILYFIMLLFLVVPIFLIVEILRIERKLDDIAYEIDRIMKAINDDIPLK